MEALIKQDASQVCLKSIYVLGLPNDLCQGKMDAVRRRGGGGGGGGKSDESKTRSIPVTTNTL